MSMERTVSESKKTTDIAVYTASFACYMLNCTDYLCSHISDLSNRKNNGYIGPVIMMELGLHFGFHSIDFESCAGFWRDRNSVGVVLAFQQCVTSLSKSTRKIAVSQSVFSKTRIKLNKV